MEHIQVFLIDLPVSGLTIQNEDDSYSIFINAQLSSEMQLKEYDKQIGYIDQQDLNKIYRIEDFPEFQQVC